MIRFKLVDAAGRTSEVHDGWRLIVTTEMAERLRASFGLAPELKTPARLMWDIDIAINGDEPLVVTPEMEAAGAAALRFRSGVSSDAKGADYYPAKAIEVYRAMEAARQRAGK